MDQVDPVLHPTIRPASKRELLARLDRGFLSAARLELVRPHALKGETGPRPISVNTMPQIQLMRQYFNLRNPAMEAALCHTPPLRGFAVVGWDGRLPDEITVVRFRHSSKKPKLTKQILAAADATPILASTPTKIAGSEHAEPRTNAKGEALHFGMKAHIGGDAGYQAARKRRVAEKGAIGHGATRRVKRKVLDKTNVRHLDQVERSETSAHDKVEHPIRPIKRKVSDMTRPEITVRRGYRADDHAARCRPVRSCSQSCWHWLISSCQERRMWPGKAEKGPVGRISARLMLGVSHGNLVNSWV